MLPAAGARCSASRGLRKQKAIVYVARPCADGTEGNEGGAVPHSLESEFERQCEVLLRSGYDDLLGISEPEFRGALEPLRSCLPVRAEVEAGRIPFVIVVRLEKAGRARAAERIVRQGKTGLSVLTDRELPTFTVIGGLELPGGTAYLVTGVDTGNDNRNVTPDDALTAMRAKGREPLTIDEGIAVVTQFPETIRVGHGFSLAGSRCGDRRVMALWISKGAPKLGWCWAGNPHTWLGSASCSGRLGPG